MEVPPQAIAWGPLQAQTARGRFERRQARLAADSAHAGPTPAKPSRQTDILEAAKARAARRRG